MKDVGSGINSYLHKSNSNYEKTFHEKSFFEEEEEESTDKEYKTLTGRQQSIIKQQMTSGSSTLEETKELKKISARLRELEGEEGDVAKEEKGAAKEEETAAKEGEKASEAQESYWKKMLKSGGKSTWDSLNKERSFPKKEPKEKSTGTSSSLALYVLLFIIAALDLFAKKSIGYEPKAALLISTVTGIIFFLSTKSHPGQRLTVIGAFVLDAAFSQGLLYLVPETGIKETLIAIHVFIWIILAVILFLWNFFEHLAEGHKPSVLADLTFVAILGFIIFISYPLIIETQLIQANTHSDYFQVAKEKAEEVKVKFSETSQKWSDYLQCSLEKDAKDPSIQPCLKKKRAERFCENDNKPLSPNYNKCVQNLLEEGKAIGGKTDSSYTEHSSLKFNTEEFPGTVYTGLPNPKIILEINNPRELSLSVDFYCNFSKLKENFPGTPSPITLTKLDDNFKEIPLTCKPPKKLEKGSWRVSYSAEVSGLETKSTLQKIYVNPEKTKQQKDQTKSQFYSGKGYVSSSSPELARINFMIESSKNPLIELDNDKFPILSSSIENLGSGEIISIQEYSIDLKKDLDIVDKNFDKECLFKSSPQVNFKDKKIPLTSCTLELVRNELASIKHFVPRTYHALLKYKYRMTKELTMEVAAS